MYHFKNVIKF